HEGCAHRLALRQRANARDRVLGLPARPELPLPAGDVRRGAVGVEAQGRARRADPDVPARGHPRRGRRRRDERLLAHHGLHLPEDRLGRRVAIGRVPMRIAAIGVSHWHSLYDSAYLRHLAGMPDVELVGLQDNVAEIAARRAAVVGNPPVFIDYREMLAATRPDFVIALGRHSTMAEIAHHLLDHGYPFLMEKPMGVNAEEVRRVAEKATAKNAFVAVPLAQRYQPFVARARQLLAEGRLGPLSHFLALKDGVLRLVTAGGEETAPGQPPEPLALLALRDALMHWRRGEPAPIGVADCARVAVLIDHAYDLAARAAE